MSFPDNISKEHIIQAFQKIEREGIPLNGDSNYYDVEFNGKYFPPKLVVSLANLFANGIELDRNSFEGGLKTPCFDLLSKYGFEIVTKELDEINSVDAVRKYLNSFKDDELLLRFLEFANGILSEFGFTESDKRIAYTLRKNGKQISLNLGRKLILALYRTNNQNNFCFYINERDVSWARKLPGFIKEEIFNSKPKAHLLYFSASDDLLESQQLIQKVKIGIADWLPSVESAGQPERHNRLIYNLIMNDKFRGQFFSSISKFEACKEQVMVYEVKKSAVKNALELRSKDERYFYWNDATFKKMEIGDYVFVVIKGSNEVLFTKIDSKSIRIDQTDAINTYFEDDGKQFVVSGMYDQFVRLNVLHKIDADSAWQWKSLGSSETTYLSGSNVNKDKAENRIINIKQLLELSKDIDYRHVLNTCLLNFQTREEIINPIPTKKEEKSNIDIIYSFLDSSLNQNLYFDSFLTKRYIASLATKPFVIFTGLSGSGKTKLAQTFSKWISTSEAQYKVIPVGADWTNREPLLGYPNSLDSRNYVLPDNGALDLILNAIENAKDKKAEECVPYFLILDEMNLSHVERYFADFLSGMESKEAISLYTGNDRKDENGRLIPKEIKIPPNLFIVGTVNIDETTYMFSPKVLDRANTIEFRLDQTDLEKYFDAEISESKEVIDSMGSEFTNVFMQLVNKETEVKSDKYDFLLGFFDALQSIGAEFGYRTANEMNRLIFQLEALGLNGTENSLDVAVMQKLLPKLHGSRTKLNKVLPVLASFCLKDQKPEIAKTFLDEVQREGKLGKEKMNQLTLVLSFSKIARMYCASQENGFASYAEG